MSGKGVDGKKVELETVMWKRKRQKWLFLMEAEAVNMK